MHGVKEVFDAVSSTVLLYACATNHLLATFVPSLQLSCISRRSQLFLPPAPQKLRPSKRINNLETFSLANAPGLQPIPSGLAQMRLSTAYRIGSPSRFGAELHSFYTRSDSGRTLAKSARAKPPNTLLLPREEPPCLAGIAAVLVLFSLSIGLRRQRDAN